MDRPDPTKEPVYQVKMMILDQRREVFLQPGNPTSSVPFSWVRHKAAESQTLMSLDDAFAWKTRIETLWADTPQDFELSIYNTVTNIKVPIIDFGDAMPCEKCGIPITGRTSLSGAVERDGVVHACQGPLPDPKGHDIHVEPYVLVVRVPIGPDEDKPTIEMIAKAVDEALYRHRAPHTWRVFPISEIMSA